MARYGNDDRRRYNQDRYVSSGSRRGTSSGRIPSMKRVGSTRGASRGKATNRPSSYSAKSPRNTGVYRKRIERDASRSRQRIEADIERARQRAQAQGGAVSSARQAERKPRETASAYSRENAAKRYSQMERRTSNGGANVVDKVRSWRAGSGGGVTVAGRHFKLWPLILVVILALLLVGAIVWYVQVSEAMKPSEDVSAVTSSPGIGQPYYVLLMGSDSRSEDTDVARADSIMLCRVDEANKKVTMISLPRDLRVQIEGHGYGKLNSTLTYDGYSGAIKAVSELAGVPISYYATIYFSGFKQLVDDLGGVTVEVPKGTYYKGVSVPAGKHVHINGKQALVLARCRHGKPADQGAYAAGDYQRTKNQRNLMKAIVKKIMKKPIWEVPSLCLTVAQCIETNMPAWKLAKVAISMRGIDTSKDMYSATAPATSQYINGVSYQILEETQWKQMMARVEDGEDPNGS